MFSNIPSINNNRLNKNETITKTINFLCLLFVVLVFVACRNDGVGLCISARCVCNFNAVSRSPSIQNQTLMPLVAMMALIHWSYGL